MNGKKKKNRKDVALPAAPKHSRVPSIHVCCVLSSCSHWRCSVGEVDDTDRAADGAPSTAEVGPELIQTSATLVLVTVGLVCRTVGQSSRRA